MAHTFVTKLIQEEGKNATGFRIPTDIVEALNGGKRPTLKVTINSNYVFSTTIGAYGDVYMLPLSQERRTEAGIEANEDVTLTLELDTAPRTVEVPDDMRGELEAHGVSEIFDGLAYSKRKEFVRQFTSAKAEETRQRRLTKIIASLQE